MLEFEVDLSAIKALGDAAKRLTNFDAPLRESGAYLERQTKNRFSQQKDPDGRPWEPLAKSTLRRKKTRAILRETGSLIASIAFLPPSGGQVKVVSGTEYGSYHQTGVDPFPMRARTATARFKVDRRTGRSRFAKKEKANFEQDVNIGAYEHPGIPARPFLGINSEDVEKIRGFFDDYISGRL